MQFLVRFFRLRARSCISYHMVEMIKKKKKTSNKKFKQKNSGERNSTTTGYEYWNLF